MKTKEQRTHDHEEHLLTREKSICRSRSGAIVLVGLYFLTYILYSSGETEFSLREDTVALSLIGCIMLSAILAYQYGMQVKHIDTIKMYRSKLKAQTETESSQHQPAPYCR